jgi:hypothetical protein
MSENDDVFKGLSIMSQGLGGMADQQQAEMAARIAANKDKIAQGQKMWEAMQQDREQFFKHAGNKDFPKNIRVNFYNNAVALDKQLGSQSNYPAIDAWDEKVGDVLDAFGVIDAMEDLDPKQKLRMKNQLIAQQQKIGNTDQGKFLQDVIKTGQEQETAMTAQDVKQTNVIGEADRIIGKVDQALEQTGLLSAGLASLTKIIPATPAKNLDSTVDTIKANLGFAQLQQMREASPTGGALGQVSERELTALQSALSSLDQAQSPAQLKKSLKEVSTHYQAWKDIIIKAKGEPQLGTLPKPTTATLKPFDDADKEKRYQEWKASQGK